MKLEYNVFIIISGQIVKINVKGDGVVGGGGGGGGGGVGRGGA